MQEVERSRLEREAELGRRWAIAQEVWSKFIARKREETIGLLEGPLNECMDVDRLLAQLRVLKDFDSMAKARVEDGRIAERKLNDG